VIIFVYWPFHLFLYGVKGAPDGYYPCHTRRSDSYRLCSTDRLSSRGNVHGGRWGSIRQLGCYNNRFSATDKSFTCQRRPYVLPWMIAILYRN